MKLQAVRIDRTMQGDREINLPYRCFACHDGGLVGGRFLAQFVDGDSDIPFICNRDQCEAGRIRRTAWQANESETYRASFDTRLDRYACNDIHTWEKEAFLQSIRDRKKIAIFDKYIQEKSDRQRQIEDIKDLLMDMGVDISDRIRDFVQRYRDRDKIHYPTWEELPTAAHAALITNLRNLRA